MIASAERATRRATACSPCSFARTRGAPRRRCGCATSESRRSATHFTPVAFLTAAPTRCTDDGGEVVITTSMPSLPHDADRRRDRRQVPAHVLVGDEQAPPGELRLPREAHEALRPVQLLGGLPALRAEVARAMHPGERRRLQLVVAVDPLRVVRREHVRLDAELRQMRRELERPLDAPSPGRREVEADDQHLHCGRR